MFCCGASKKSWNQFGKCENEVIKCWSQTIYYEFSLLIKHDFGFLGMLKKSQFLIFDLDIKKKLAEYSRYIRNLPACIKGCRGNLCGEKYGMVLRMIKLGSPRATITITGQRYNRRNFFSIDGLEE